MRDEPFRVRRLPPAEFGPTLAAARRARGMTGAAVAQAAGISAGYWRNLEAGIRAPSVSVALAVTDALGLDGVAREVILSGAVVDAGRDHPRRVRKALNRSLRSAP